MKMIAYACARLVGKKPLKDLNDVTKGDLADRIIEGVFDKN